MTTYNKAFRKDYDKIFCEDPLAANMMLLFFDLADKNGEIMFYGDEKDQAKQVSDLMNARFENCKEYQL